MKGWKQKYLLEVLCVCARTQCVHVCMCVCFSLFCLELSVRIMGKS